MKQPYEMRFGKWGIRFEIGSLLLIFLLSQISFNANFVQLIWSETRNNQEKNQFEISFFRADVISNNPPLVAREKPSEWSCERPVIAKNVPVEPACRLNKPRDSIPRRALTPNPLQPLESRGGEVGQMLTTAPSVRLTGSVKNGRNLAVKCTNHRLGQGRTE